jgi:hypothetical protein
MDKRKAAGEAAQKVKQRSQNMKGVAGTSFYQGLYWLWQ